MKKNFLNWMGTLVKAGIFCFCALTLGGLTACSDDDDNNGGQGSTTPGLVNPQLPKVGWSGSTDNGIATYRSADMAGDDEMSAYYAYSFKDGKCTDAVFNIVCQSETMAKYLSQMLNSGQWADDEEEAYNSYSLTKENLPFNPVVKRAIMHAKAAKAAATKAMNFGMLGISCTQSGRIVYFKISAMIGLDGATVKFVSGVWDTGLDLDDLPARPVFGTWDEATGKYTSRIILGLPGSKVEVEAGFSTENKLNKYKETWTLPNAIWAELMEQSIKEQAESWGALSGAQVEVVRTNLTVTIRFNNPELTNLDKEAFLRIVIAIDILNARPICSAIF